MVFFWICPKAIVSNRKRVINLSNSSCIFLFTLEKKGSLIKPNPCGDVARAALAFMFDFAPKV